MAISKGWVSLRSMFIPIPWAIRPFVSCKLILAFFLSFTLPLHVSMNLWFAGSLHCISVQFPLQNFQAALNLQAQQLQMAFPKVKSDSPSKPPPFFGCVCVLFFDSHYAHLIQKLRFR